MGELVVRQQSLQQQTLQEAAQHLGLLLHQPLHQGAAWEQRLPQEHREQEPQQLVQEPEHQRWGPQVISTLMTALASVRTGQVRSLSSLEMVNQLAAAAWALDRRAAWGLDQRVVWALDQQVVWGRTHL